ncbi:hypothetical protein A3C59_04450 [Candidatus Daviesbacteria bacterium RIFCSPHIGHO2_02_FULL_36_13]|uniref:Uncharacterized protein n=1 Tax=Candidatus Daviesbacteria bacterium RIFCSPHIGHO2_02_FULL_36_13 TaxID=1797768 RepID=A0A1F5JW31_9BACT|nr:MAG: hypothetical protein A3C59_04450 [Candidatus Daviesbacteria bacterium RIFCSPHIGHO2_02_FULL_36_13]OGE43275.1 MAG: hypothetical protein A3A45_03100 [Candidatus Daviesbacteria bacterium RIFCSPLOWO2_01_FULL_36_8]
METAEQQLLITEEQIVTPAIEILNEVSPLVEKTPSQQLESSKAVVNVLDTLFPEQQFDEKNIQKAKEILGSLTESLSPQQLRDTVAEFQYLVNSWLDDFEREIFKGKTLKELLHEKGGV